QQVLRRLLSSETPEGQALGSTQEARYNAVFRGGLRIYTTYDRQAQGMALDAVKQSIPGIDDNLRKPLPDFVDPNDLTRTVHTNQYATASMVSIDPTSGAVRVLVGGPTVTGA